MTQEALKKMYQLLLTEPHAPTVCAQLERIAREALADHAMQEVQRLGQEIEQEPVGAVYRCDNRSSISSFDGIRWTSLGLKLPDGALLYTSPPQRTWVGLTGLDQKELMAMSARDAVFATEVKLKQKNGYAEEKNT